MGRTTLTIDDDLLRELKKKAAEEGRTVQAVTNGLIKRGLRVPERRAFTIRLKGWPAKEQPGVDLLDRDKLFDLMSGR